jgi:hypothetical protein
MERLWLYNADTLTSACLEPCLDIQWFSGFPLLLTLWLVALRCATTKGKKDNFQHGHDIRKEPLQIVWMQKLGRNAADMCKL